jgi:HemY protein
VIRLYLILLLAFAIGVGAVLAFAHDSGYVLIHYQHYALESSVPGLLLVVVVASVAVAAVLRLVVATLRLPQTIRTALRARRVDTARRSFELGLLRLLEGDWKRAELDLVRRAADHDAAHLNYLAAAHAAQRLGAAERRDEYLRLAARGGEHVEIAMLLTQADLLMRRGEYPSAKAAIAKLRERNPQHPHAVSLLAQCQAALGEWEALLQLLADTESVGAPTAEQRAALAVQALRARIATAVGEARLDHLKAVWERAGAVKANVELRRDYVRGLARLNADAEAAAQITATLAREWDGELVRLFGDLHAGDAITQLAAVEQWLTQYGERPEILLVAGSACLNARLWGKAQSYLEAALRAAPGPRVYFELARLSEQTQKPDDATRYYRQGLELAATAPATAPR